MELTDGIHYIFELLNHGIVRFGHERVCDEEEFDEWTKDRDDGDAVEEQVPLIKGLERVDVDHEDGNNGELLERECGICLQSLKVDNNVARANDVGAIIKSLVKLPSGHVFHETCVLRWLYTNHVCPFCRLELSQHDGSDDSDDDSDDDPDVISD
ncbi:E3 ubiquitin-protein ligase SDIR1-like [Chenopodium quinoa]|uniref:E3 ubiquitin-protein ligase SDIR1-like n=1 Tax=Chenopodium quinoa TaxID=63459 RepID=UPI000B76FA7C|nr:E3 ubiquitin-protein ligase SDIR1-like [Chenopodium quinoa]